MVASSGEQQRQMLVADQKRASQADYDPNQPVEGQVPFELILFSGKNLNKLEKDLTASARKRIEQEVA